MDLTEFSEEALLEALTIVRERKNNKPKARDKADIINDLDSVIEFSEAILESHLLGEYTDYDEHYAFKRVLELVFGKDVWIWWHSI